MLELIDAIQYRLVQNKSTVVNTAQVKGWKLEDFIGTGTTNRIYPTYEDIKRTPAYYPCLVMRARAIPDMSMPEFITAPVEAYILTVSESALIDSVSRPREQLRRFFHLLDYWLSDYDSDQSSLDFVVDGDSNLVIGDKYSVASFTLDFCDLNGFNEAYNEYQGVVRWMARLIKQ